MRKRFLALMASLALILTGGLIAVTASPAAASYATCPAGQSCLYTGANGAGTQTAKSFSSLSPVGTCVSLTLQPIGGYHSAKGGFGSGYAMAIYSGTSCTGWLWNLYAGDTYSNEFTRINSVMITP